ncbi:MAG: hypothetical protein WC369_04550 [Dehalococcoidales bacterium]|jgi:hypothetical protein
MARNIIKALDEFRRKQGGQALITVLILLMLGSLTLPPMLSHLSTSLKTGEIYQSKTNEMYAADSGIEDAIWQIKYDRLAVLFDSPEYDAYDYTTVWSYDLPDTINGLSANVTVQNVWIPKDVVPLSPAEGKDIIESSKLIVAGTATTDSNYRIRIDFFPGEGEEEALEIESLGIWLPLGYTYVTGSSNLEEDPFEDHYSVPVVSDHAGGQAIVWEFSPAVSYTGFPGVSASNLPMSTEISFEYTAAQPGERPVAISWMETSGVSDTPLSWDIDTKIFKIISTAGDTRIEAYPSRCELRKMAAAIAGDYRAVGNSLMQDNYYPYYKRDTLISSSTAEVTDIPSDADVIAAYLYWSGWYSSGYSSAIDPPWPDTCGNFNNWTNTNPNTVWQIYSGNRFRGHYIGSDPDARYLEMTSSMDLSGYSPGSIVVEWDQQGYSYLDSTDGLQFQFSADGGSSWGDPLITAFMDDTSSEYFYYVVPEEYLTSQFKMRFYLADMTNTNEYAYIDNFAVAQITGTADAGAKFWINGQQVYLDGDGQPQQGVQDITASQTPVLGNKNRGEYSYASFLDVSKLVKAYSDLGDDDNHTGNGEYTVGDVDADTGDYWSYAGWSLIIVFSSQETAGHQLFLYDTFAFNGGNQNLDFDGDGEPGGNITGFVIPELIEGEVNAAKLTCFVGEGDDDYDGDYLVFNSTALSDGAGDLDNVWDSQSIGMSEPGVDIDTFYVTWASGLLHADDIEAQIDMPSGTDNWNLIYMILSLRSETITGGTVHYVIRGG